ncbi:MAG: A/G-specific adenine glycosylase [Chitinivibrionales bacterium]|nr:A/G-specific adenine glycosylase [Chitinivibrionales bacterium]
MLPVKKILPAASNSLTLEINVTPGSKRISSFQKTIHRYYEIHGRSLPWRSTGDPYHIVVSEIMLQQTQVDRVVPKYLEFIHRFPDFHSLARASLDQVLALWHGLGYNRRALSLKKLAEKVIDTFDSRLPESIDELITLPGIGKATASSIAAFAFNKPVVFIETNIRTVFIHFFFPEQEKVTDTEITEMVECTLDRKNPRKWYNALMDYGVMLKQNHPNPGRKSAHYKKQTPFEGSHRQIRGMVLKALLNAKVLTRKQLLDKIDREEHRVDTALDHLIAESIVIKKRGKFSIA